MTCPQCGAEPAGHHHLSCPVIWGPPVLRPLDPHALDWVRTSTETEPSMKPCEPIPCTDELVDMGWLPSPRLGLAVHYRSYGTPGGEYPPVCRAAVVTEVGGWVTDRTEEFEGVPARRSLHQVWESQACALHVTNPSGVFLDGPIARHEPPVQRLTLGDGTETDGRLYRGGTWHATDGCTA